MNNVKLLSSLLIFAEVAQTRSFTEAASNLGMSKSAVSQHISRLENEIGLQLLSRNTRNMSLTANGAKLLLRSEVLKDQVDLAFQELASADEKPSGLFSITFPHVLEKNVIIPALSQLCIEFPQIEPRIIVTDEALDLIINKLDVAIFGGNLPDSNYRALPIGAVTEFFFASPRYLQKAGMPKTPDELSRHRWISTVWQNPTQKIFPNSGLKDRKEQIVELTPYIRSNSLSSVVEMAMQDMGIVILSGIVSEPLVQVGQLTHILKDYHGKKWPFYFVHPYQVEKPIHITRFYSLVKYFFTKAEVCGHLA